MNNFKPKVTIFIEVETQHPYRGTKYSPNKRITVGRENLDLKHVNPNCLTNEVSPSSFKLKKSGSRALLVTRIHTEYTFLNLNPEVSLSLASQSHLLHAPVCLVWESRAWSSNYENNNFAYDKHIYRKSALFAILRYQKSLRLWTIPCNYIKNRQQNVNIRVSDNMLINDYQCF